MPNFTKKLRLKKPLDTEYYNIEDFNENMDIVEAELTDPVTSEELINENITSFKVGTGEDELGLYLDYTDEMEKSLVTLDNIEGVTIIETGRDGIPKLKNKVLKLLHTLDTENTKNYFEDATLTHLGDSESTKTGTTLRVTSSSDAWNYATYRIDGLIVGNVYCLDVDSVTINKGSSAIDIDINHRETLLSNRYLVHSNLPNHNANGLVFIATKESVEFYFYCNMANDSTGGDVTYTNISLRKVKEYSQVDMSLKSLPSGIKDQFKGGISIKRICQYTLDGSEDWVLSDSSKPNTNGFACNLRNALPVDKTTISLNCNKYKSVSDETIYISDEISLAIGGDGSNKLIFRVGKGINSVISLKEHLRVSEKDITIEFAIYEEITNMNISLLCEPNDILNIGSNTPIDCTHKVQLNTKSQIEELQKSFESEKKSIWSKVKEIVSDISGFICEIGEDTQIGYIKLPKILGGFIIQWGQAGNQPNSPTARFNFPIALNYGYYTWYFSPQWSNSSDHYWVAGATDYKTFVSTHKCINTQVTDACRFLVIGR